jgi:hypothetical protein
MWPQPRNGIHRRQQLLELALQTSAEAISCAAQRDIWDPPEARPAERETSAGLAGLLA